VDAVRFLADEIGPRPPCSDAEERAALWCADRFEKLGFDASV
jgi:hypothetical protein